MKKTILFFWFVFIPFLVFSQSKTSALELNITYSDRDDCVIRNDSFLTKCPLEYYDNPLFTDWSFLDSLRNQLREFYNRNLGFDTLNKDVGFLSFSVNPSGKLLYYSIYIPKGCASLYSLKMIKELNELILNFRFNFPDYKKPVQRFFFKTSSSRYIPYFECFPVRYLIGPGNEVSCTWDGIYEPWRCSQVVGKWKSNDGQELIFEGSPARLRVQMIQPVTGEVRIFNCSFSGDMLYINFENGRRPYLLQKMLKNYMSFSGDAGGQSFKWELTRDTTYIEEE